MRPVFHVVWYLRGPLPETTKHQQHVLLIPHILWLYQLAVGVLENTIFYYTINNAVCTDIDRIRHPVVCNGQFLFLIECDVSDYLTFLRFPRDSDSLWCMEIVERLRNSTSNNSFCPKIIMLTWIYCSNTKSCLNRLIGGFSSSHSYVSSDSRTHRTRSWSPNDVHPLC